MRVIVAVPLALTLLSGCLNWQSAYDSASRKECRAQVNAEERQDCLTGVEGKSSKNRIESHS